MVTSEEYNKLNKYTCFIDISYKNNEDLITFVTEYTSVIETNKNLENRLKIIDYQNINKKFSAFLKDSEFANKQNMLVLLSKELSDMSDFKNQLHYRENLIERWNIIKKYYEVNNDLVNENSPLINEMNRNDTTLKKKTKIFRRNHRETTVVVVDNKVLCRAALILLLAGPLLFGSTND